MLSLERNSYQFNKGTIPLPFYLCFLPTHHPSGKNVIHISFNNKGTIPLPVYLCFLAFFSLYSWPLGQKAMKR